MSTSVTIVSEWNGSVSATMFHTGDKFCLNAVGPGSCLSVYCGIDEINSLRDQLNEWIAEADENEAAEP